MSVGEDCFAFLCWCRGQKAAVLLQIICRLLFCFVHHPVTDTMKRWNCGWLFWSSGESGGYRNRRRKGITFLSWKSAALLGGGSVPWLSAHTSDACAARSRSAPFCTELTRAACQRCCHEMALVLIRVPDLSDERGIQANSNVRANKFWRFPVDNLRQTLSALVSAFLEITESLERWFLPPMFPSRQPSILCSHLFFCTLRGRKRHLLRPPQL